MIEYFNEDCMVGMARYPDKHFDLAIVDPPYGIGIASKNWQSYKDDGEFARRINSGEKVRGQGKAIPKQYKHSDWDNAIPTREYFEELFRVSKNQIIWGGNYFIEHLNNTSCFIVWDKQTDGSNFADCELAWTSFKTAVRRFNFKWAGMLQGNMKNKEHRIHPTQKPVALYKWLLKNYAKQGDLILDTHVGSASSLIACHDMGFDAVGFELDPDYYKTSKQRLEDFMRQPRLEQLTQTEWEQVSL